MVKRAVEEEKHPIKKVQVVMIQMTILKVVCICMRSDFIFNLHLIPAILSNTTVILDKQRMKTLLEQVIQTLARNSAKIIRARMVMKGVKENVGVSLESPDHVLM